MVPYIHSDTGIMRARSCKQSFFESKLSYNHLLTRALTHLVLPMPCVLQWPTVGSWYPLLLQLSDGIGDLAGKLLPVWHPPKPKLFIGCVSTARALLLVPVFLAMLYWGAPPAVWFCVTFIWSLSGW